MKLKTDPKIFNKKLIIAKITDITGHPNADKLQIVTLDIKSKPPVSVVCGAGNISIGQIVPLILPGGQVADGKNNLFSVSVAKIRQVESHGMICSSAELKVGDNDKDIWILPDKLKKHTGQPLLNFLDSLKPLSKSTKKKQQHAKKQVVEFSDTEIIGHLKNLIHKICQKLNLKIDYNQIVLTHPPDPKFGHFSANTAFIMAKKLKQNPIELANQFKTELDNIVDTANPVERIEIAGPGFINFHLRTDYLIKQAQSLNYPIVFKKQLRHHARGKTVVIDYSAPNIAKPFGIGHLRSTNIGQAIYNIYKSLGWNCIGDNHLGDWGTQFGKLIVAIKKWSKKPLADLSINDLEQLYIKFHTQSQADDLLVKSARRWFSKLEQGDAEAHQIWKQCVDVSLKEFDRVYKILDVDIDYAYGESFYQKMLPAIIRLFIDKKITVESQGALIIEFDNLPPVILRKSDGTTTYFTRELATVKYRLDTWQPDQIIYEVGVDQALHFQQLFSACQKIGWVPKNGFVHVAHGLIRRKEGKLSTRKGDTIHLSDVIDNAINQARQIVAAGRISKNLTNVEKKKMIQAVAIGAIKFSDLIQHPKRDIIFDWNKIMGLSGDSGPYLQYTYARCQSVLTKTGLKEQKNISLSSIVGHINQQEQRLLDLFCQFGEKIIESAQAINPSIICQYLLKVAQGYNELYGQHKIINHPQETFRIFLTKTTASVIHMGLDLLGIKTVEKM